jgi:hypothetical protein
MSSCALGDRLRELCAKVVRAPDREVEPLLEELWAGVQEKPERI